MSCSVLCQHHVRRHPICFRVAGCCFHIFLHIFRKWSWSLLRVTDIKHSDSLIAHVVLLLIGDVLAPILVTTLVSRRFSMLRVWSEREALCSDKPANMVNPALPSFSSPPSRPPASSLPRSPSVPYFHFSCSIVFHFSLCFICFFYVLSAAGI